MKTIKKWLETLPEEQRKEAEFNMVNDALSDENKLVPNLKSALLQSFVWGAGYGSIKYWSDIYHGRNNRLF